MHKTRHREKSLLTWLFGGGGGIIQRLTSKSLQSPPPHLPPLHPPVVSGLHSLHLSLPLFNLLSKHFFVALGWGALKRSMPLITKSAHCCLWFQIGFKHFLSPSANSRAAITLLLNEDLLLSTERLQCETQPTSKAVTNDDTYFGLHADVYPRPKEEWINFCANSIAHPTMLPSSLTRTNWAFISPGHLPHMGTCSC